jgi:2-dehydropantoate 2-reductase
MKKQILIIGAGAIGAFYGGLLSKSEELDVSGVTSSLEDVVRENGFDIKSSLGDFKFLPKKVFKSVDACDATYDVVIVATKVLPTIDVVSLLKPVVSDASIIVLIQNGIHIEIPVQRAFPNNQLISGLAFICVSRNADAVVHHQDYGRLVIGNYPKGVSTEANWLQSLFSETGLPCLVTDDVKKARWKKLVWNAPFNPISVLSHGLNTIEILSNPLTKELVENVMKEVQQAAALDGVCLEDYVLEKNISDTLTMKPYKTSMLLDFEQKRPLEIESILGNCIRFSEKCGVELPYMKSLYALLA